MSTTDTSTPEPASRHDFPFAVTITCPGHPTVHLGYTYRHDAEQAAWHLTAALDHTAHPEGTEIIWGATPTGVEITPPLTTSYQSIAEHPEFTAEHRFPDLYSRLVAQEGHEDGRKIWLQACSYYDQLHEDPEINDVTQPAGLDPDLLETVLIEHVGENQAREIFAAYDAATGGAR
ncbi:hypothetical protein [Amycolatopsis kentuckyensis]|uniref:hypothetical protein n=1 Tax=Amycolatopsis kentuckyensis TaxID=218823 RepID=UPI00356B4E29